MDYKKIYSSLVERARLRKLTGYYEVHHVVPRCLGGSDDPSNLVNFTAEEHYLAHQLLVKIHPGNPSIVHAACMMIAGRPSNKLYGWLRSLLSENQRLKMLTEVNPSKGKIWIFSEATRESKLHNSCDQIPIGWKKGRVLDFDSLHAKTDLAKKQIQDLKNAKAEAKEKAKQKKALIADQKRSIELDNKQKTHDVNKKYYERLYLDFVDSKLSLRAYAGTRDINPMTLSKNFKKFIQSYGLVQRISAASQLKNSGPHPH